MRDWARSHHRERRMSYLGYEPSYNFGDSTKFEFVLIPFWQISIVIGVLGALCLLVSRRVG
jgi:hypothetical protein